MGWYNSLYPVKSYQNNTQTGLDGDVEVCGVCVCVCVCVGGGGGRTSVWSGAFAMLWFFGYYGKKPNLYVVQNTQLGSKCVCNWRVTQIMRKVSPAG